MLPRLSRPLARLRPSFCRFLSVSRSRQRKRQVTPTTIKDVTGPRLWRNDPYRTSIPEPNPSYTAHNSLQTELDRFLATVNRRIEDMLYSWTTRNRVVGSSYSDDEFEKLVLQFRDSVMSNLTERMEDGNYTSAPPRIPTPELLFETYNTEGNEGLDQLILKHFRQYFIYHGRLPENFNYTKATTAADMRNPGEWYPGARSIRRKIIMHVGPTNSGKTYQALKRLELAKSGWYGGPLRLLAHEVFNRMNNKGVKCNLRTGEEIRTVDINAPLTASTIEMFSDTASYDIAVIDEIQMLADQQRGFAWTSALLGLRAKELHLCGEEAAVPLVTRIAKELGDEIEVNVYERLSPLKADSRPIRDFRDVRSGDCIVVFSRRSIFNIKDRIEKDTGMRCALVYGALPPETRSLQANLFNDPNSGFDVLVASDAIGMGLNLYLESLEQSNLRNIKRVIFASLMKFDAGELRTLHTSQIKQIAGRAGRFGVAGLTADPSVPGETTGLVTSMDKSDIAAIREAMATPNPPLEKAYLWPPWKVFEKFTHSFPEGTPLATMLSRFTDVSKTTRNYQASEVEAPMKLAHAIEHIPNIDLESRYSLVFVPLQTSKDTQMDAFVRFAEVLSNMEPVTVESSQLEMPLHLLDLRQSDASTSSLQKLETLHKLLTCYCWLS